MVQMEVMGLTSYLQQTPGFVVYLTILFLFFFGILAPTSLGLFYHVYYNDRFRSIVIMADNQNGVT